MWSQSILENTLAQYNRPLNLEGPQKTRAFSLSVPVYPFISKK